MSLDKLPGEIRDNIFLYLEWETLNNTRELQSKYVKYATECNNYRDATNYRNLENIKWIFKYTKYPWDNVTYSYAARSGNLDIIKWFFKMGCPWCEWTFAYATGDITIMKWLHANNCPWDELTFANAICIGNITNMKWLLENGCPYNKYSIKLILGKKYINENLPIKEFLENLI